MILETAKLHFDEDVARAGALRHHATGLPDGRVKDDVLRSAWMVGVGASDAYFCDAYADLVARTLRAKEIQRSGKIPDRLGNLSVPAVAVLDASSSWRWRMAARGIIEKQSVLSLDEVKKFLNLFCRNEHKLLQPATIEDWIIHAESRQRNFGITPAAYNALAPRQKSSAKKAALEKFSTRMQGIFQRRHDCIHNCDRPRIAIQGISDASTEKAIADVQFLVDRCTEHLRAEYPRYMEHNGFTGVTRNKIGA
ncbi:hypothetical protein [Roseibium album]|uniref:hypothetical protein n=1 Tax=Roseibium album TaxID=311410 RepID=UPI0024917660|nr:hypothetical protein [Roseibium album]